MSASDSHSLLTFLDAPVLVGDPEGQIIYANPAFVTHFCETDVDPCGESLAARFDGGGREAVLSAVARVCASGETARFRLREDGHGYIGLASPIESGSDRVGVMILFTEEPPPDERVLSCHDELQEPLKDVHRCLDELLEQTGGRRHDRYRDIVEEGIAAIERARKWLDEMKMVIDSGGSRATDGHFDPVRAVRQVGARVEDERVEAEVGLSILASSDLQPVRGSGAVFERVLLGLVRARIEEAKRGAEVMLLARSVDRPGVRGILVSVVDGPPADRVESDPELAPPAETDALQHAVQTLGGELITLDDETVGRVTSVLLVPA